MAWLLLLADEMVDWITTSTILEQLRSNGQGAWERFVERFRAPIVSFARQSGCPASDAEDVAQETLLAFTEAFRRGQYDRDKGRLSRWLFGIAHRQLLRSRHRALREKRLVSGDGTLPGGCLNEVPDATAASVQWDLEWERTLLEWCLRQVERETSPATFRAFELVVRDRLTPQQAAEHLGVPVKTIYNAKHRVLERIRELRSEFEQVAGQEDEKLPGDSSNTS